MKIRQLVNLLPVIAIAGLGVLAFRQWHHPWIPGDPSPSDVYQVLKVADGDTITVRSINTGKEDRVRFACIDAPEVAHNGKPEQPFGEESKANLQRLIDRAGREVIVQEVDRDRYGRLVGEAFVNARNPQQPEEELLLNAEQVRSGMAYVYRQYAKSCDQVEILDDLEREAKVNKKGVWAGSYQKPWEFRRSQR